VYELARIFLVALRQPSKKVTAKGIFEHRALRHVPDAKGRKAGAEWPFRGGWGVTEVHVLIAQEQDLQASLICAVSITHEEVYA